MLKTLYSLSEIYSNYSVVENNGLKLKISSANCQFSIYSGDDSNSFSLTKSGTETFLVNHKNLDRENIDSYVIVIQGSTTKVIYLF